MKKKKRFIDPFKVRSGKGNGSTFASGQTGQSDVYATPKRKKLIELIERAQYINRILSEVKPLYSERDKITMQLLTVKVEKLEKYGVAIKDNFADKIVAFRKSAFNRYELIWKAR